MERLFVTSTDEAVEVTELMQSARIADHLLAIDALTGWARTREETTLPPECKDYYDTHHWYNKQVGRGALKKHREQFKEVLRRDVHESLEAHFGWLAKPMKCEIDNYKNTSGGTELCRAAS